MGATGAVVVCLAYILGLLVTALPWGSWMILILGIGAAIARRWLRGTAPLSWVWLLAGVVGFVASLYLQLRVPQARSLDVSQLLVKSNTAAADVLVEGKVASLPRLTRSEKAQFWLDVQRIAPIGDNQSITGRVYVTVPFQQGSELQPGQQVSVGGSLYLPKAAANPGGFDFQNYLQQDGSFAGLSGEQVSILKPSSAWGLWFIQQRIVRSQQQGLGTPEGQLVSAMVLGSKAVDLPFAVKDAFVKVGLAHALAASGFQTSLILGVVLVLTRRCSDRLQFLAGTLSLLAFVGLAGLQPAVLRAAIMGFGGLVALVLNRKVKPLNSLLLTATLLLLVNPLWIWDLGFQLSFLATMGLLVTVPVLSKRLDWLPGGLIPLIAVPVAAYLWTLPLQLGAFGVLSPYSIPANLITTPFISLISLGGMASGLAALVWSPAGSALAWCLKVPTQLLIAIVNGFSRLPGNNYAVGSISVLTVLGLYGLLLLVTFHPFWQRRWRIALAIALVAILIPLWAGANLTQVTILSDRAPVMVIRDRGRITVINGGDAKTARYTLLPFLQQSGINQIHWAIAPDNKIDTGWNTVSQQISVKSPMPLPLNQPVRYGSIQATLLRNDPTFAQFTFQNQTWLWLNSLSDEEQEALLKSGTVPQAQVLWVVGKTLKPELVKQIRPEVAIATAAKLDPDTLTQLQQAGITLYYTGRDGAIQWTKDRGFQTTVEASDNARL